MRLKRDPATALDLLRRLLADPSVDGSKKLGLLRIYLTHEQSLEAQLRMIEILDDGILRWRTLESLATISAARDSVEGCLAAVERLPLGKFRDGALDTTVRVYVQTAGPAEAIQYVSSLDFGTDGQPALKALSSELRFLTKSDPGAVKEAWATVGDSEIRSELARFATLAALSSGESEAIDWASRQTALPTHVQYEIWRTIATSSRSLDIDSAEEIYRNLATIDENDESAFQLVTERVRENLQNRIRTDD